MFPLTLLAQVTAPASPAPGPATPPAPSNSLHAIWTSVMETLARHGLAALGALAVLLAGWVLSRWASRAVRMGLERARFDVTLTKFLVGLTRYAVLILAAISCLAAFGVNITTFAAMLGAGGLAIGLGFQGALSNLAAGLMLLVTRPFKVGDSVVVDGFSGTVDEIELFSTRLNTFDNRHIIMPNSSIFGKVIENATYNATRRADVNVGVAYDADIDATRDVLTRAIASLPGVLKDPAPTVALSALGGSTVDWVVRVWAKTSDLAAAKEATIRAIKLALDEAGIAIPYPQMDVHVFQPRAESPS